MKNVFIRGLLCFSLLVGPLSITTLQSVSIRIHYEYDDAGNRIVRKVVYIRTNSSARKSAADVTQEQIGKLTVHVYPNPTKGWVEVTIDGGMSPDDLLNATLYSSSGNILQQINNVSDRFQFDLSSYPNGLYIVEFISSNYRKELKIIKE